MTRADSASLCQLIMSTSIVAIPLGTAADVAESTGRPSDYCATTATIATAVAAFAARLMDPTNMAITNNQMRCNEAPSFRSAAS